MAFSFSQSSLLLLVLWLAFLSGCFADLIADVCTKAQNSSLCNEVLRSAHNRDPNLVVLGQIAYSYAEQSTFRLQEYVRALSSAAPDPGMKSKYTICLQDITNAFGLLTDSKNFFYAKQYFNMLDEVNDALNAGAACDRRFTTPKEPSLLKQGNLKVRHLTSIVAAVGDYLLKH